MIKNLKIKGKSKLVLGGLVLSLIIYGAIPGFPENLTGSGLFIDEKALAQVFINSEANQEESNLNNNLLTVQENSLLPISNAGSGEEKIVQRINVVVTAYSSSPLQTDNTPYITASGTYVREGIVANNLLSFGTRIKIPEVFGEKVFVVEDRLHSRKGYYHVDIWYPSRKEALNFGKKWTYIEVVHSAAELAFNF